MTTSVFHSIKLEPKFSSLSTEMLKVLDMLAIQKNGPQPSYEYAGA